jgi:hypothetical protein
MFSVQVVRGRREGKVGREGEGGISALSPLFEEL